MPLLPHTALRIGSTNLGSFVLAVLAPFPSLHLGLICGKARPLWILKVCSFFQFVQGMAHMARMAHMAHVQTLQTDTKQVKQCLTILHIFTSSPSPSGHRALPLQALLGLA